MADSALLLDSNILIRWVQRADADYALVASALDSLSKRTTVLCYTSQNLAEFWNARTRPADRNGFGLTPQETDRRARFISEVNNPGLVHDLVALIRKRGVIERRVFVFHSAVAAVDVPENMNPRFSFLNSGKQLLAANVIRAARDRLIQDSEWRAVCNEDVEAGRNLVPVTSQPAARHVKRPFHKGRLPRATVDKKAFDVDTGVLQVGDAMLGKQGSRVCGLSFEVEIMVPRHNDLMFMEKRTHPHSGPRNLRRFSRVGEVPSDDQHVAVRDPDLVVQAVRVGDHNNFHNGASKASCREAFFVYE
jgi:hypothetical protein